MTKAQLSLSSKQYFKIIQQLILSSVGMRIVNYEDLFGTAAYNSVSGAVKPYLHSS